MNAITFDTEAHAIIDATDSISPIPVVKLKWALKSEAQNTVLAIKTTDPTAQRDLRDFCASTGNAYLGLDAHDAFELHYIKKTAGECQTCSTARTVLFGVVAAGALAYTAPMVVTGDPSGPVTFVFLAAFASLPPVVVNNARLVAKLFRQTKG